MSSNLESDVAQLLSERAIRRVIADYCRGVDRGDLELVQSCYHPGAHDIHGRFRGDAAEFAEHAVDWIGKNYRATNHTVLNSVIDFDDAENAHVETYVNAFHYAPEPIDDAHLLIFAGRYIDRFARRAGQWRIETRVLLHDWSLRHPLSEAQVADEAQWAGRFIAGERNRADLGYADALRQWLSDPAVFEAR